MKGGWRTAPLNDVANFINGLWKGEKPPFVHVGVIRNTNFTKDGALDDTDIAYLDVESKKFQTRQLQFGDLILEKSGGGPKQPVGRVILFDKKEGDFSFSNFTAAIRVIDKNELAPEFLQKYLHWVYLSGRTEAMQSHSTGIRNLNGDVYKAIEVPYPLLSEQRRIVAILDEAFEGIATAKANAEKNLQNARDLPPATMACSLSVGGNSWSESKIGDQLTLQRGFDITKDQQRDGLVPVVSSGGVRSYHDTPMVRAPGVVLGRKGTLGKVFFFNEDFWPHDTTLWVKDFKGNDPRFVYRFLQCVDVKSLDSGAANPALNRNQVHALRVLWPPVEEQRAIVEKADSTFLAAEHLQNIYSSKIHALEELKKSLLHQAFTGQL